MHIAATARASSVARARAEAIRCGPRSLTREVNDAAHSANATPASTLSPIRPPTPRRSGMRSIVYRGVSWATRECGTAIAESRQLVRGRTARRNPAIVQKAPIFHRGARGDASARRNLAARHTTPSPISANAATGTPVGASRPNGPIQGAGEVACSGQCVCSWSRGLSARTRRYSAYAAVRIAMATATAASIRSPAARVDGRTSRARPRITSGAISAAATYALVSPCRTTSRTSHTMSRARLEARAVSSMMKGKYWSTA